MTVAQLIERLKEFPQHMPVTIINDINWVEKDDPHALRVSVRTWIHGNYPYDKPNFDYVNID